MANFAADITEVESLSQDGYILAAVHKMDDIYAKTSALSSSAVQTDWHLRRAHILSKVKKKVLAEKQKTKYALMDKDQKKKRVVMEKQNKATREKARSEAEHQQFLKDKEKHLKYTETQKFELLSNLDECEKASLAAFFRELDQTSRLLICCSCGEEKGSNQFSATPINSDDPILSRLAGKICEKKSFDHDSVRSSSSSYSFSSSYSSSSAASSSSDFMPLSPLSPSSSSVLTNLRLCNSCLVRLKNKLKPLLPVHSIANGFDFGEIPVELSCLNPLEIRMISLVLPLALVWKSFRGHGGGQYFGKGHATSFHQNIEAIATQLPRHPKDTAIYQFAYTDGTNTMQPADSYYDPTKLKHALLWLKANNPLYAHVKLDFDLFDKDGSRPCVPDPVSVVLDDLLDQVVTAAVAAADSSEQSIPAHCVSASSSADDVFIHADASILDNQKAVLEDTVLRVNKSKDFVSDYETKNVILLAFPHLFPYGRGGPDDARDEKITDRPAYHRHLFRYHDRRFAHNVQFHYWVYNRFLRQRSSALIHNVPVTVRQSGESAPSFLDPPPPPISIGDLRKAGTAAAEKRRISADGAPTAKTLDKRTKDLLDSLAPIAKQLPGTAVYMRSARKHLMSMLKAGSDLPVPVPTFFLTLSSADLYWPELLRMIDPSLTDAQLKVIPVAKRKAMLAANPMLASQHFNDRYQALLKHIINGPAHPLGHITDH
jgi:hypothetical protein